MQQKCDPTCPPPVWVTCPLNNYHNVFILLYYSICDKNFEKKLVLRHRYIKTTHHFKPPLHHNFGPPVPPLKWFLELLTSEMRPLLTITVRLYSLLEISWDLEKRCFYEKLSEVCPSLSRSKPPFGDTCSPHFFH